MKKILYGIGIIIAVLLVWAGYDKYFKNEVSASVSAFTSNIPEEIFDEYGVDNTKVILTGYFNYGDDYLNDSRTEVLLDEIAGRMGINSKYQYERVVEEDRSVSTLTRNAKDADIKIAVTTIETEESKNVISQNSFIDINMVVYNSIESGIYYRNKIADVMESFYLDSSYDEIYMSITGEIQGNLDIDKQKEIAESYLSKMRGKLVFDNINDGYYSLYGFCSEIKEYASVGKDRININIVFTYDELSDKTIIHIGSPIVNYDY